MNGQRNFERAIQTAAQSGTINLSGWDLEQVPAEVFATTQVTQGGAKTVDFSFDRSETSSWWEVQELQKLILSHNRFTALPDRVATLEYLTCLDVSHNQLTQLPECVVDLENLKTLEVSSNKLQSLPEALGALHALVQLKCSDNTLRALPPSIGDCQALVELQAGDNQLQRLPGELARCRSLTALDLQGNLLTELPARLLDASPALTDVNFSRNRLAGALPEEVGSLQRLVRLDLRQNAVSQLPASLAGCSALAELYLGANKLRHVPPSLAELPALGTLDLRDNALRELPGAVGALTRLTLLDLTNNALGSLPPELGLLTQLRRVVLDGNPLRTLRQDLVSGPTPKLLQALRNKLPDDQLNGFEAAPRSGNVFGSDEAALAAGSARAAAQSSSEAIALSMPSAGLEQLPEEVWATGARLTALDASCNKLQQVPALGLAQCVALRKLDLHSNALREWPLPLAPAHAPLAALHTLHLAHNPLQRVPPEAFDQLPPSLTALHLSGCPGALPSSLHACPQLEELGLAQMKLRSFPAVVLPLARLRVLDVSGNNISSVPREVEGLRALEQLDLTNNDVRDLPPEMGRMGPTLSSLGLEGNCLKSIRRPVLDRGTAAVLEYLAMKIR